MPALRKTLTDKVPGATLDDHRGWIDRMRAMADFVVLGGIVVLALVIAATILSVTFATRGAMAANRPIIEVLHFVGAQAPFHRRSVPAPFPVARPEGRRHRRQSPRSCCSRLIAPVEA